MTNPIAIHQITRTDATLLNSVAPDVFDAPINAAHLAAFLAEPNHAMFVATDADTVIGQARGMIHHSPDDAPVLYIDNLGVAPSHQRRGIATRLVAVLGEWANTKDATTVWVATETDNEQAKGFYAALGLTHTTVAYFEKK